MANIHISYEHYLAKGQANRMRLLMQPDQIPSSLDTPVLWQCLVTGSIEDRSYHSLPKQPGLGGKYGSHGQHYWAKHRHEYYELAAALGIEFVYDETVDYAPSQMRSSVKWRGRRGNIVCVSLHKLKYDKIPYYIKKQLGLLSAEEEEDQAETESEALHA